jgi:hypothetical protein
MKWNTGPLVKRNTEGAKRGVEFAAIALEGIYKRMLRLPGPPPPKVTKRQKAARKKRAERLQTMLRHSLPGEPPRTVTGTLAAGISHEPLRGGLAQRVGTPEKYGFWLEFGTKQGLEPRPWLRPGLRNNGERLGKIILAEMRKTNRGSR